MCMEKLEALKEKVMMANKAEKPAAMAALEEGVASEIVRLHTKQEEIEKDLSYAKKLFIERCTRKIIPVGGKVVEIKLTEQFEKPTALEAVKTFGIDVLLKAGALTVSASKAVRTSLGMVNDKAVAAMYKQLESRSSVTVRDA